jgi:large subunit ribosomal protein L25
MEIREITVRPRHGVGKQAAKQLRRAGHVPAVMYGGTVPMSVAVAPRDIFRITHGHEGSTQLVRVTVEGAQDTRMAIIRDLQWHPVSEDLLHVDLQEVAMDRPIQVSVAVHHVGEAKGVKDSQGILEMILREVQVSCLPGNIPDVLEADVSGLGIGDVLTVGDLKAPEGVRVITDAGQAVATVAPPAAEVVEAPVPVAAAAAAPAEPEVLTERKPKEETTEKKDEKKK